MCQTLYCQLPVLCPFAGDAVHLQEHGDDFPVDIIVLCYENVHPGNVGIVFFRTLCFVRIAHKLTELFIEGGTEQRLTDEAVHSGIPGDFLKVRPVIGGDEQDWNMFANPCPDITGSLNTVHLRHFPVEDHQTICLFAGQD